MHTTGESGAPRRAEGETPILGGGDHATLAATEVFVAHRNLLFTVAYEMLGSGADADDVLQETWLRWVGVDAAHIDDPRAYLVRITTGRRSTGCVR
ncbi:sigma factor [Micromonospora sp. NPDC006431]|uniref:sigma factor n=1 Tax=Micromonospora sp. NPDC006431 TaxID=3364235 RepID=UPI0036767C96